MVEVLLDDNIPQVWVSCVISFIVFLLDEVYLTSSLSPNVSSVVSSLIPIIILIIPLGSSSRILLELFGHTVFLKMAYLIASPVPNVDASP